ncbi:MAG: alpha-L-rhamnosidase C-terminal domain-containing protein [Bacteroidota bacterium]
MKQIMVLSIIMLLLGCSEPEKKAIEEPSWTATWIRPADLKDTVNTWSAYKKTFALEKTRATTIRLAVDSKYWMWLNDSLIVREGQLKRGPAPLDTYYDEIDISSYLTEGENTLAMLVWYFGKDGFTHKSSGQQGLIAEIRQQNQLVVKSDSTWKAIPHPGYINESAPPHPNWRLPESNIVFDSRKDLPKWFTKDFDDSSWPDAKPICKGECLPWGKLVRRPVPQWKDFGLKNYVSTINGDTVTAELPYNAQVTPYLKVNATAGSRIVMFTDHYKGGSAYNMRGEYITKEGVQEYESPGWINGHKVYYVIPKGVEVIELKYRESGYDTEFAGSFSCNDDFYNQLWQKAARTLYVTMRDNYMDCPDRERAQWWGDEVLEGGEAFYALDRNADALMRKGMLELVNWQREDSTLFSPVPAGNWNKELPGQMLTSVGEYGFWNYYLHTGDLETIRAVYEPVKKYLGIWKLKDDGTLVMRQGGWFWGDWGPNKDMVLLLNTQYALAVSGLQKMADALGEKQDADSLKQHFKDFKSAFNQVFWKQSHYRSAAYQGPVDDRSQGLAVVAGLAETSKYPAIYEVFQKQEYASPYMEKYILESLFVMGYPQYALERMKKRFSTMVNHPTISTLWEGWGIGAEGYGGGTTNHAWSGGGLTLLSQKVAGVYPLEPGYQSFQVKPQLGNLTEVSAVVSSVSGEIKVAVKVQNNEMDMDILVPENTSALGYVPADYTRVLLNGAEQQLVDKEGYYQVKLLEGMNKINAIR